MSEHLKHLRDQTLKFWNGLEGWKQEVIVTTVGGTLLATLILLPFLGAPRLDNTIAIALGAGTSSYFLCRPSK